MQFPAFSALAELGARWYVFFFLNVYGWGKIFGGQFFRRGHLPAEVAATPLGEASAFELGWTFMGYSPAYIAFIGVSQLIGAWCLLWPRTKLLGVAILLPILVNIIAFDLVYLDAPGALLAACLYLSLLLYVLYYNRATVRRALLALTNQEGNKALQPPFRRWQSVAVVLIMIGILFCLDQGLVSLVGR
ncbi:hypothetical protein [Lewinella sp. W8]|uniref:hypothetical protein n=1 Tax=Lewinella sp. W8 TaxID=2528208 RepID=UPI001068B0A1|nr:hypothetical protein [Lewinella sp. W8]MTB50043.1 hypothetical protein [Lewinella sp. W8]